MSARRLAGRADSASAALTLAPLSAPQRAWRLALAFLLLALASPGSATPDGSSLLALMALAVWSATASRPGPWAASLEVALGALAWAWICSWAAYVWWGTLLVIGPGMGLYMHFAGATLRRLARWMPLAAAAPMAWMLSEGVRAVLPPPFGFQWMRLGTHLHSVEWLSGSARVWGVGGLSFALAAAGGLGGALLARQRARWIAWGAGLGPASLGVLLGALVPAPRTAPGPRLLLVQPAIPQARKMEGRDPLELFEDLAALTSEGLAATERAGRPPPDLVCWSETMLPAFVGAPGLLAEVELGARFPPWMGVEWGVQQFRSALSVPGVWVDRFLLGAGDAPGLMPPGTAFLAGAEYLSAVDGVVRRQNAVLLWPGPGAPRGPVSKLFLVPGAETMLGLERLSAVRGAIRSLAGYLPDLYRDPRAPRTLELEGRSGRRWRFSAAVCFDNAFDEPFTRPLREGPLDFHLVASNEAWFRSSLELDQMMAFSRLAAIATGRSLARCTNSGVSALFGANGSELARLQIAGRDREVRGALEVQVPVPPDPEAAAARTPFVRLERLWAALWIAAPAALLAFGAARLRVGVAGPVTPTSREVGSGS